MSMQKKEYEKFYDRVGSEIGWDFSGVKCTSEGAGWNFYDEVTKRGGKTDFLLDIGTGGGEKVLQIAACFHLVIGIDISARMIAAAKQNQLGSKVTNARFFNMDAEDIKFPDNMFDLISCRHSAFSPAEIFRLLDAGGVFLSQQVSEADKMNIKDLFGRGQSYRVKDGSAMAKYAQRLNEAGFSRIETWEYDAIEYYESPEDLIFLLKHTPIITNFGEENDDFKKLDDFIRQNTYDKGIKTNSKRYMIIAEK